MELPELKLRFTRAKLPANEKRRTCEALDPTEIILTR
jgi:hypothetical protein